MVILPVFEMIIYKLLVINTNNALY